MHHYSLEGAFTTIRKFGTSNRENNYFDGKLLGLYQVIYKRGYNGLTKNPGKQSPWKDFQRVITDSPFDKKKIRTETLTFRMYTVDNFTGVRISFVYENK